jgi:hypothetical protein
VGLCGWVGGILLCCERANEGRDEGMDVWRGANVCWLCCERVKGGMVVLAAQAVSQPDTPTTPQQTQQSLPLASPSIAPPPSLPP